ncbi:MAG TPA: hypothetical protein VGL11_08450 [Candidatus Binatia bacterium]|jgi:hypothetical protein
MAKSQGLVAVAVIGFLLFAAALIWFVSRLVRSTRADVLATFPVAPEQEVNLPALGEVLLMVEAPRFSKDYMEFQFELVEKQTGRSTRVGYHVMQNRGAVYGVKTMRVSFERMTLPQAGAYVIRAHGLQAGKDYSDYRVMLSRPFMGRLVFQIVGIILCAGGMLGSLIWGLWLLGMVKQQPEPATQTIAPRTDVPTIDLETWKRRQRQEQSPKQ